MTERWEEGLGMVLPGDLDAVDAPEPHGRNGDRFDWDAIDRYADRVTRSLENVFKQHGRTLDRVETRLQSLSLDLAEIKRVQSKRASQMEEVLANQKREFDWFRESHAWLRGAITAGAPPPDPAPRGGSRVGVASLCLLWALTVVVAFGAGAVAFGGLRIDVAREAESARLAGPTLSYSNSADEHRLRRALMMETPQMPILSPSETVSSGEERRPSVVPPGLNTDFAGPVEDVRPTAAPSAGRPVLRAPPLAETP
ncbi:MAG: hypothetical protein OXE76_04605 [Alphaproteobacteria bacterium]|nr:hypothetical protein [Alphaproteobacteria bacterium]